MIGDKAQFRLNGNVCTQNVRCYASRGNTPANFVYETNNNDRQSMRAWAGVIDNNMIGPFFYVGNLNSQRYIQLITNQVLSCLQQLGY